MAIIKEEKKENWKSKTRFIFWATFYLFVFSFLLNNSLKYLDPDLGWHISVGEQIIREHKVPSLDYYNYTLEGKNWVDHEWLSNAIIAFIFNKFGYAALSIVFAIIATASLWLAISSAKHVIPKKLRKSGLLDIFLAISMIFGLLAMSPSLGVRVQEVTILFSSILSIILIGYSEKKNTKIILFVPFLFWVWSMLHGGFLIGFLIISIWIAALAFKWLYCKHIKKTISEISNDFPWRLIILASASFFATFLTPYGAQLYYFLKDYYQNTFYLLHISEWLPLYAYPFDYYKIICVGSFLGLLFFYFLCYFQCPKKERKSNININIVAISILALMLLILSLRSQRNFPLFFVSSLPLNTYIIFQLFLTSPIFKNKIIFFLHRITISLIVLFIFCSVYLFLLIPFGAINKPFDSYCVTYPCEAVMFLKSHPEYDDLNIFNYYGWGGYLIHEYPERKLFIDGRLPQYSFKNQSFLEEYFDFYNQEKIDEKIREYDIKLVFINNKNKVKSLTWLDRQLFPFYKKKDSEDVFKKYLQESADWKNIYQDDTSLVYVRN